ncbi:DNRLRE domain-containing protein [Fodinicola feengrottensis]|uniref:DNRLRE domain-containing protein n=1 Tax=Fodinicola feengrottensis TaxID=435914 RepID=UPI0024419EF8|nr:DNRLRE domain-containing protein [Fodinicola feengrottensis]
MDLTLVRAGDGSVSAAAAPTSVVFSGGGSGPLVRIGTGTANVALSWPGGSLPAPSLSGDMATYPNVLPDVDLRLTADVDGYTEVLVVKTLTAASNPALKALRFGLAATGVSTVKDRAGDIDFRDGNGNVVFHAPTPTMWDSPSAPSKQSPTATDPPATEPDRVAMGVDVSASALTITPNQAMLTGTGTQFPVYLDPSVSAGRRAWTSVWAKFPTTSYWNSSENVARVGHVSEQGDVETNRSFFWLATDPVNGKHILSATLRVTNAYSYSCTARPVDLWLTGAITSSTTWNSQPSWMRKLGSVNAAKGYDSSCPAGELEYNALSAIQQQAAAGGGLV